MCPKVVGHQNAVTEMIFAFSHVPFVPLLFGWPASSITQHLLCELFLLSNALGYQP